MGSEEHHSAIAEGVGPVASQWRVAALDVARGVALLGIFVVNVQSFAEPFSAFMAREPESDDALTVALFWGQKVLCEGKFYPLFSMLFGIGLILQMQSVESRGGRFARVYLRRLGVLLAIGLFHALALWYGDILVLYALCGALLMLARKWPAKGLLFTGAALVAVSVVLTMGMSALESLQPTWQRSAEVVEQSVEGAVEGNAEGVEGHAPLDGAATASDAEVDRSSQDEKTGEPSLSDDAGEVTGESLSDEPLAAEAGGDAGESRSPLLRLFDGYQSREIQGGPEHPMFAALETEAYRDGPWHSAFGFRAMCWAMYIIFSAFSLAWQILGLFFIGAGVYKAGLLDERGRVWRRVIIGAAVFVAFPMSVMATYVEVHTGHRGANVLLTGASMVYGPVMSLGYLCIAAWAVQVRALRGVTGIFGAVGRMALTNYLSQTLIATFVFYWWGLGQFGQWTRSERDLLVICVYAAQCVLSVLWLRAFRFGPMEWVWRTLTYGRAAGMRN